MPGSDRYGLIFDVDGVIADTESVNARASIEMFAELFDLHEVRREDFEAGLGRGAAEYVRAAATVHGLELSDEDVVRASESRQTKFLEHLERAPLPAFPGVLELLASARASESFDVAIATSSTREKSQAVLTSAGVPFPELVYITGSDVTHKKPHPELFLLAAERLGIEPARCVVIEDAPNGIEAAHAAGARCIAVTNSVGAEKLAAAELVVSSVEEVSVETLKSLLNP